MNDRAAAPSNAEIAGESDPIRRALLAAMQRIVLGHPKLVPPGTTSISHLAQEAGVGRHHLYQTHPDLKDRYEYIRDHAVTFSEQEVKLQAALSRAEADIVHFRELHSRSFAHAEHWKATAETLSRVINVLQEELRQEQLRSNRLGRKLETKAAEGSPVIAMRMSPTQ